MKLSVIVALVIALSVVGGVVFRLVGKTGGAESAKGGAKKGGQTPTVETATAGPATIETTLRAVGSLQAPFRVQLSPRTSGRIEFLQVREGDRVKKGEVLIRIDPSTAEATVAQQRSNLAEAQSRYAQAQIQESPTSTGISAQIEQSRAGLTSATADLEQTRKNYDANVQAARAQVTDAQSKLRSAQSSVEVAHANIEKEKANLANAQVKYDRAKALADKGYVPQSQVDDTRTALDVQAKVVAVSQAQLASAQQAAASAEAQVEVAQQNLKVASQKGQADIAASTAKRDQAAASLKVAQANTAQNPAYKQNLAALQASVQAAQAQLNLAQANRSETVLKSSIDGFVTARTGDVGSLAQPGTAVLTIESLDWLYFNSSLPIDAAPQLREGMKMVVHLDARPDQAYPAVVEHINPSADNPSRQFTLLARVDNPGRVLHSGMFGSAELITQSLAVDVAVPREAVRKNSKGNAQIAVLGADSKVTLVPVTLGVQSDRLVEIKSGISAGDKVVTLAYGQLRDGMTVALPGEKTNQKGKSGGKGQ